MDVNQLQARLVELNPSFKSPKILADTGGRVRQALASAVIDGEPIIFAFNFRLTDDHSFHGTVLLTDRRVLMAADKPSAILFRGMQTADIPLNRLTSVEQTKKGMFWRLIIRSSDGNSMHLSWVADQGVGELIRRLAAQASVGPAPAPLPAPMPGTNVGQELKAIAELYASGILSADEFAAAKARVLG
jgi:hypothetical protein